MPGPRLCVAVAFLLVPLVALAFSLEARAGGALRVAAAADLRFAMEQIVGNFQAEYPAHRVEVIYGSSGRFRAQIKNGAPFDLYFSADIAYPRQLQQAGFAAGEVTPYALGRLVLWSNSVDASALTLESLAQPCFRRIAIANPRHAPYGERAEEALRAAGVWEQVEPRLVYGENIAHALQLVQSGAAEVGIVALSLALNPRVRAEGGYHLIDEALHRPLEQGFIITRHGATHPAATLFAEHMNSPAARDTLSAYGFILPDQ